MARRKEALSRMQPDQDVRVPIEILGPDACSRLEAVNWERFRIEEFDMPGVREQKLYAFMEAFLNAMRGGE